MLHRRVERAIYASRQLSAQGEGESLPVDKADQFPCGRTHEIKVSVC
jgi:hypothetical protein